MAKKDTLCKVTENIEINPGFCRMTLDLKNADKDFSAGQFFNLKIFPERNDPLLRRPFAPSEVTDKYMRFVYAVVGKGTEEMAKFKEGQEVSVLFPLGNGFAIPEDKDTQCILVGGGCGAPSLLALAEQLKSEGMAVHIAIGARSECSLLEIDGMSKVATSIEMATDDGSFGIKGHAVAAAETIYENLEPSRSVMVYACGPDAMLKGVTDFTEKNNLVCEVSLEARMACGFGACVGCVVKVRDENAQDGFVYKKVCKDGPVFNACDLIWE